MEEEKAVEAESEAGQAQEENFEERRKAYRLNKVLGATIEHRGEVTQTRLFVIDISTSGFRATSHIPLPEQEDLKVSVALSKDEEPLEATARIVWQKELTVSGMFQLGSEFVDLPEEQLERLESFIEGEKNAVPASKPNSPALGRPWTMIRD
ncbi:MAG: PilZ domain-containing protein [Candidatus Eremiobacteraeota bacterium]|nr:PilZ domain-containing protein [Candidatus Eremiobacteraeota bacterium]